MKKSVLYLLCAGALVFGLTACGGSPEEDSVSGSGSSGTEQIEGSDSSEGENQGDSEEVNGSGSTGEENDGSNPGADAQPGDAGNEDGSYADGWSGEMTELRAAAVGAVGEENYWPDMPLEPDMLQGKFGLTSDMYEDYMAELPMMSAHVDTLIIIRAKEGQADAVYDVMNTYREGLVNDTMQYPMNLGKIQASQLAKEGDYIIFLQLGGETPDEEEDAIRQCQDANQQALDAILEKLGQ